MMATEVLSCESCHSDNNVVDFRSELCLHMPKENGPENKPAVFVFPKLLVCLKCGRIQGNISVEELQELASGAGDAGIIYSQD